MELIELLKKSSSPSKEDKPLAFIMSDLNQDLFSHVALPPPQSNVEELTPQDYHIWDLMLGKPTLETMKMMVTTGIKEVFRNLEQDGVELIELQRQNEILKGYFSEFFGPLDPTNPEETLKAIVERKDD